MREYFNIKLEFDHAVLEKTILDIATGKQGKGYCCFVDLNSLVDANKNPEVMRVINEATINSCDGSYIAMSAGKIHKVKLKEYIGPDFFKKFIYSNHRHLIIGNTQEVFDKVKAKVTSIQPADMTYLPLPFKAVEDFDYDEIATFINQLNPDFIWVSLGAPKQEQFMNRLVKDIKRGMLIGVGAATNYFSGEIKDIPNWTRKLHIIWIYRIFTEPKKQIKRMTKVFLEFPKIYRAEKKKVTHGK